MSLDNDEFWDENLLLSLDSDGMNSLDLKKILGRYGNGEDAANNTGEQQQAQGKRSGQLPAVLILDKKYINTLNRQENKGA